MTQIKEAYNTYSANYFNLTLVLVLTLILLFVEKENLDIALGKYLGLTLVLILNPFTYNNIRLYGITQGQYYQVFFLLPVIVIISYLLVRHTCGKSLRQKGTVIIACLLVGFICTNFTISTDCLQIMPNLYRAENEIIGLKAILEDNDVVKACAPMDISTPLLETGTTINFLFGYEEINGENLDLGNAETAVFYQAVQEIISQPGNIPLQAQYARQYSCDCFILKKQYDDPGLRAENGLTLLGTTETCVVYQL